jgi:ABC-type uncharacterized transport system permease subunit
VRERHESSHGRSRWWVGAALLVSLVWLLGAGPLGAFPGWLEQLAQAIPYTGLIATVRGLVLDGRGLTGFGSELAIGAGWIAVLLFAAARTYRFAR